MIPIKPLGYECKVYLSVVVEPDKLGFQCMACFWGVVDDLHLEEVLDLWISISLVVPGVLNV